MGDLMTRTIRITGEGKASAKVDYVILSLRFESKDFDYDKAVEFDNKKINDLNSVLSTIGYKTSDLKTSNFNVRAEHKSVKDENDNYKEEFNGYCVSHDLKLAFDFDNQHLSNTLKVISKSETNPDLRISFTVKDDTEIKNKVLKDACANAKERALILARESNVKLGDLLSIDYSFSQLNIFSDTEVSCYKSCSSIEPEDIETKDSATFVWEIL